MKFLFSRQKFETKNFCFLKEVAERSSGLEKKELPSIKNELAALKASINPEKLEKQTSAENSVLEEKALAEKTENPDAELAILFPKKGNKNYAEYREQIAQNEVPPEAFSIAKFEDSLPSGFRLPQFATKQFAL